MDFLSFQGNNAIQFIDCSQHIITVIPNITWYQRNIRRTIVGNKTVDHSNAARTTSSFST